MVWKGIKNYFVNLKHFFSPVGAFALGVVFGLSVLLPAASEALRMLADSVARISGNMSFDFPSLFDSVVDTVSRLDWNEPAKALKTMLSPAWLNSALNGCIHSLLPEADMYAEQIASAVNGCIESIAVGIVALFVFSALGLLGGFLLTRYLVKKTMAKRAWWKNFLSGFIDTAVFSVLAAGVVWLESIWPMSVFISTLLTFILFSAGALFKAHLLFGWKKIPMKRIVNVKNTGLLILSDFCVFSIAVALVAAITSLTNAIVGTFVAIPLIEIALLVILFNAEAYVKRVADGTA